MRIISVLVLVLSAAASAFAQDSPPAPEQQPEAQKKQEAAQRPVIDTSPTASPAAPPHRFFENKNKWLFAGVAVSRSLDFASTKYFRRRGRDEILLTNDVVDNSPAFVAVEAGGVAVSMGLSYLFHRKGHHKLERWVSMLHIGVTTFGATRNFMLKTRQPAAMTP